jgi:hypothetical protein
MKEIQYSVTILGSMKVPDNANYEEIKTLILADYWENEPNDIEFDIKENK